MTDYPNREHRNADETARQQAMAALDAIAGDAMILKRRLENGTYADVSDAESLVAKAVQVARRLAVLGTLREVREWEAADRADRDRQAGNCPACHHLRNLHGPDGCAAKVYPAHSLTGEPCPCEHPEEGR